MSEMLELKKVESTIRIHHFNCDICGKDLGSSEELEDGYYSQLGCYGQSFNVNGAGWYKYNKNLCDKCKEEKTKDIKAALIDLGFVPDRCNIVK